MLVSLCIVGSTPEGGAQPDNPVARSGNMIGSSQMSGRATGRLVCLQCALDDADDYRVDCDLLETTEDCEGDGRRRALQIAGRERPFPILPGNDKVRSEIVDASMNEERVTVTGRYYPTIGVIFASSVIPAE